MGAERRPGSDRGRPVIDWEEAFVFYASLLPERRGYRAVAEEFGVSVRTVEKHGRLGGWKERMRLIAEHAAAETNTSLGRARAEQIEKMVKLIEASLIGYAEKLRRGEVRMAPADLDRLHRLWQQLFDELGEPMGRAEPVAPPLERTPEHAAAVAEALRESGALEALGLYHLDSMGGMQEEAS